MLFLTLYLLFSGSLAGDEAVELERPRRAAMRFWSCCCGSISGAPSGLRLVWLVFLLRIPPAMLQESWLLLVALAAPAGRQGYGGTIHRASLSRQT